ncbi:hypothetical protein FJT64_002367 [Amphibalanus amphitrite]|uniref:Peptidase aspartic putative domain-containing protein n=1 Tax=Amphibalanus amphitrite TaxID=1232801 RepID=A0A6A4WH27_AMPAM|nr:hypothetical protein FJT64_002367 [Amphibalanus amphitrite]
MHSLQEQPEGLDENIELADDFSGGQVDILIGTDQYYKVVLRDCVVLDESLRALDTIFGYVIHGKGTATGQSTRHVYHCQQVEQMWDLESMGKTPDPEAQKLQREPEGNSQEERYGPGLEAEIPGSVHLGEDVVFQVFCEEASRTCCAVVHAAHARCSGLSPRAPLDRILTRARVGAAWTSLDLEPGDTRRLACRHGDM